MLPASITITVSSSDQATNEGQLVQEIYQELQQVDDVEVIDPSGTKGIGTLSAQILDTGAASVFIQTILSWLLRDNKVSLKISIDGNSMEATGLTKAEQQELIQWFKTQVGVRLDR